MDWGTDLVFKHHRLHVQHTQFHYLQSKVTKQYPQNFLGKLGTYWYVRGTYLDVPVEGHERFPGNGSVF